MWEVSKTSVSHFFPSYDFVQLGCAQLTFSLFVSEGLILQIADMFYVYIRLYFGYSVGYITFLMTPRLLRVSFQCTVKYTME